MKPRRVGGDGIPAQCRNAKLRQCGVTWGHLPLVLDSYPRLLRSSNAPRSTKDVGQGHDYLMVLDVSDDDLVVLQRILTDAFRFMLLGVTHAADQDDTKMTCIPFGRCEPCPEDSVCTHDLSPSDSVLANWPQLREPFCQPFGNRRLMHCTLDEDSTISPSTLSSQQHDSHPPHPRSKGEIPAWQSCGRIVSKERSDYFEFILCNAFFAAGALALLFARSRRMEIMHARQLAARIGLVRGGGGVLVRG